MRLLADNILVKILERKETNSGLILMNEDDLSLHYAKVIKAGEYLEDKIKKDNIVCFPKLIARKFKYDNEEFALITESDVILVFENEEELK
jgi:co-chaperonin GroES (HSP10)